MKISSQALKGQGVAAMKYKTSSLWLCQKTKITTWTRKRSNECRQGDSGSGDLYIDMHEGKLYSQREIVAWFLNNFLI